jgi:hypothetical protein
MFSRLDAASAQMHPRYLTASIAKRHEFVHSAVVLAAAERA